MKTVQEDLAMRLRRTELLLLRAVRRQRDRPEMREKGGFWGSSVTDDEVDALLMEHGEYEAPVGVDGLAPAIAATTILRDEESGRFGHLRRIFELTADDADLLLLAIAPEISAGYAKIFSYLHDNLSQGYLTVDLASRVLRDHRTERLALTGRLMRNAPIVKNRLVVLTPAEGVETFSNRRVAIAPRLLRWLLEEAGLPESPGFRSLDTTGELLIPQSTHNRLSELNDGLKEANSFVVVGATEGAREAVAIRIAQICKRPLVRIDLERCSEYLLQPWDLIRELYLSQAIPYLVNVLEAQDDPAQRNQLSQLGNVLSSLKGPVLIGAADRRTVKGLLGNDRPSITIVTGKTHLEERQAAWSGAIAKRGWDPAKASDVAERFYSISGTTISRVLDRAAAEAGSNEPTVEQLWAAAREGARPEFRGLAQHIVPRFSWDDLILSDKIKGELSHLVTYLEHQETIFHRWGAREIRPRGYGIKALFSGPPGTGKTMAAEVIAGKLGLDMFRVDLSQVISRWVGETEKNLKQIFDAAEGGVALILFDEADALFGSRGDVKQAQDRFANQEVSFLLQRLETFEGCAVLTTNLQENIDEAFLRRFGAVVEFQMPSPKQRELLWHKAIPRAAPKHKDLDLERLAKQFVLAGGSIVNAAINACVLAAKDDSPVAMKHAVRAVGKELIKMGKQVNRVHFGEFYDEVADL
jgi:AAA+ superfamily predicted ATPase